MRRERGGPVTERYEPMKRVEFVYPLSDSPPPPSAHSGNGPVDHGILSLQNAHPSSYTDHPFLLECLYTHFQHEKYHRMYLSLFPPSLECLLTSLR